MAYKVKFTTVALFDDGKTGNIAQFSDTIYTDWDIPEIKTKIDLHYACIGKKLKAIINSIELVDGFCLPVHI